MSLLFVPYRFDIYDTLPKYLRDSAAKMVRYARADGVCWFSVRTFAGDAGLPKSTASRHLDQLTAKALGFATRQWVPGLGYLYTINPRFLPRGAVSHGRISAVPRADRKNKQVRKTEVSRESFGVQGEDWPSRMRVWRRDGYWNRHGNWGEKPGDPGCRVPAEFLRA